MSNGSGIGIPLSSRLALTMRAPSKRLPLRRRAPVNELRAVHRLPRAGLSCKACAALLGRPVRPVSSRPPRRFGVGVSWEGESFGAARQRARETEDLRNENARRGGNGNLCGGQLEAGKGSSVPRAPVGGPLAVEGIWPLAVVCMHVIHAFQHGMEFFGNVRKVIGVQDRERVG